MVPGRDVLLGGNGNETCKGNWVWIQRIVIVWIDESRVVTAVGAHATCEMRDRRPPPRTLILATEMNSGASNPALLISKKATTTTDYPVAISCSTALLEVAAPSQKLCEAQRPTLHLMNHLLWPMLLHTSHLNGSEPEPDAYQDIDHYPMWQVGTLANSSCAVSGLHSIHSSFRLRLTLHDRDSLLLAGWSL